MSINHNHRRSQPIAVLCCPNFKLGFSLIELSLVLVILGLLIGSVLSGRSLIRASELRSVMTDYQKYYAATFAFKDKYFLLPGDMTNATQFWGAAAVPASCAATVSTDIKTCDGDGDGRLATISGSDETFRFWQHLANAGLIEGQYNGVNRSGFAKLPDGRWGISDFGTTDQSAMATLAWHADGVHGNTLKLLTGNATQLKTDEMWGIDKKIDDGKPMTGKMISFGTIGWCTNALASNEFAADYLLTYEGRRCVPLFHNIF